ncbi:MAG: flippase-like domain-containing protein [Acidimicrobiales bacterium]|jgi:uncharacterized membrane protein YbhN (UPF0104 family)/tRNA A-37 threonylcarbamoyl transferase component Bud32|nr:flippase-like domain-containing protein [Acidimicrobiales bacterium]
MDRPAALGEPQAWSFGRRQAFHVFTPSPVDRYRRRPSDVVRLIVSVVGVGALSLVAADPDDPRALDAALQAAVASMPDAFTGLTERVYQLGTLYALALVLLPLALARDRRRMSRDAVLAGVLSGGASVWVAVAAAGMPLDETLQLASQTGGPPLFPGARLALVVALVTTASPYLSRSMRRVGWVTTVSVAGATVLLGVASPAATLAGFLIGWASAAVVHLALGSPAGLPTAEQVADSLVAMGIRATGLAIADTGDDGVVVLHGRDERDRTLRVRLFGHDAIEGQALAKAWRTVWYRDSGPDAWGSRLQQVEHEAYVTFMAAAAGVGTPEVVGAGLDDADDALLVQVLPDGRTLAVLDASEVSDALLAEVWAQVAMLHRARVAHGLLNTAHVLVGDDGRVTLVDFGAGSAPAVPARIGSDVAELLVSSAVIVGQERALAAARDGLGDEGVVAALPYLQTAALSGHTRRVVRGEKELVEQLRSAAADATGTEAPPPQQLRRVKPSSIFMAALTLFGISLILSSLQDVGIDTLVEQFRNADWSWVLLVIVLTQTTNLTQAVATTGAVSRPLPLGITTVENVAQQFAQLFGGMWGGTAMQIRYFQKLGIPGALAVSSGLTSSAAYFAVQIVILIVGIPLTKSQIEEAPLGSDSTSSGGTDLTLVWILVAGAVVALFVVLASPALRAKVFGPVKAALHDVAAVLRTPRKATQLFGGNLATQLLYGLSLWSAIQAFGGDLDLLAVLVANTAASLFAGLIPVPGNMGVAEAATSTMLAAYGLPPEIALAAAILQRMFTYYLPPIWGWVAMRWLVRQGYL